MAPKPQDRHPVLQLSTAAVCGALFGSAIYKSGVFRPEAIRAQMRFEDFTMVVVFLSAVGTSLVSQVLLGKVAPARRAQCQSGYCSGNPRGLLATLLGTATLGVGMSVGGSCPGTTLVGLGAGQWPTPITVAGGLAGALVYALVEPALAGLKRVGLLNHDARSVASLMGVSGDAAALGAAGMMAACVAGVLKLAPPAAVIRDPWDPVLCGVIIGSLQVPLSVMLCKNTGSASSYATLVSWLVPVKGNANLDAARWGVTNLWQVVYVGTAAAAAYGWGARSGGLGSTAQTVSAAQAFVGGFLILFGSRLAGGCTSGHGIAGTSHMALASWLGVMAMFAGGIPTALLMSGR